MVTKKSISEKIAEIQQRKEQLESQLKMLSQKQKEEERKARTRRLIERGAMLESFIDDVESLTNEQIKDILTAALINRNAVDPANDVHRHRKAERAVEPSAEDLPPRRSEPVRTPTEEAPTRRSEPARATEEFRRSGA